MGYQGSGKVRTEKGPFFTGRVLLWSREWSLCRCAAEGLGQKPWSSGRQRCPCQAGCSPLGLRWRDGPCPFQASHKAGLRGAGGRQREGLCGSHLTRRVGSAVPGRAGPPPAARDDHPAHSGWSPGPRGQVGSSMLFLLLKTGWSVVELAWGEVGVATCSWLQVQGA